MDTDDETPLTRNVNENGARTRTPTSHGELDGDGILSLRLSLAHTLRHWQTPSTSTTTTTVNTDNGTTTARGGDGDRMATGWG